MHCSSNSELLCGVILIGLLQRLKNNQLFIYLAFVKIWDAWNELRYCGNPTTLLWSAPGGLQDNRLHFNAWFCFSAGGNVHIQTVWNAECTDCPPHTNTADETQKARIENIWLTSCLLLQHFRHTQQQREKPKRKQEKSLCAMPAIFCCLLPVWETHFGVIFFNCKVTWDAKC